MKLKAQSKSVRSALARLIVRSGTDAATAEERSSLINRLYELTGDRSGIVRQDQTVQQLQIPLLQESLGSLEMSILATTVKNFITYDNETGPTNKLPFSFRL